MHLYRASAHPFGCKGPFRGFISLAQPLGPPSRAFITVARLFCFLTSRRSFSSASFFLGIVSFYNEPAELLFFTDNLFFTREGNFPACSYFRDWQRCVHFRQPYILHRYRLILSMDQPAHHAQLSPLYTSICAYD
jgi:hypothetical protein